jgi:hypothetical protein
MELEEEDDEFDMQDNATGMEGARVNSDLDDAFITNPWPPSNARRATASPPSAIEEWPPLPLPNLTTGTWPIPVGSSALPTSSHSQQASLRRAARSRIDFSDFTLRRRSSNRGAIRELGRELSRESSGTHSNSADSVTEPRDGPVAWNRSHGRRLFPFSRTRQHETMWSEVSDSLSAEAADDHTIEPIMPTLFDAPTTSDSYSRTSPDAEDILIRAPRLRRRNMHAPEPQSVHTSPVIVYVSHNGSPAATPPARQHENELLASSNEEPIAYPTPGSSENETVS